MYILEIKLCVFPLSKTTALTTIIDYTSCLISQSVIMTTTHSLPSDEVGQHISKNVVVLLI